MPLPAEIVAQLRQPHLKVNVGDIWRLPEKYAKYPGGKSRYCLIVALESAPGAQVPARAHYVAGSTKPGGQPVVALDTGEANLPQPTFFRIWWSGSIDLACLVEVGEFKGRVAPGRREEIRVAIQASNLVALKKLVG